MFYYTYVLKSQSDKNFYTGWTNNLKDRIAAHNAGKVDSTKPRRPFKLVYLEGCLSRDKAIIREKQLKTGYGRRYINSRV